MTTAQPAAVVVLAAGAGTRMRSATPKVLHALAGRTILGHALAAAQATDPDRIAVVVRHERDRVAAEAVARVPSALVVDQDDVPGTGRAVQCALSSLDAVAQAAAVRDEPGELPHGVDGPVLVLAGDIPLIDGATLTALVEAHVAGRNAVTVLTAIVPDATGYGRILRDDAGEVVAIVEHKDATDAQREVREINSSIFVFDAGVLRGALGRLGTDNAQGEVYLTDVLAIARTDGGKVRAVVAPDPALVEGVNDRVQLATLGAQLNRRLLEAHMRAGVTIVDPASTWTDVDVELGQDVTVLPGTQLHGTTRVGAGATVGPDTTLRDVVVGEGATVTRTHGSGAVVGEGAEVGPFAFLRPGADLGAEGKIGAFVEVKNSQIGEGAKVPHLTYVGDATIGEHTNIGAGAIFANYDGVAKHRTVIGAYVKSGSGTRFVAPVTVGDGAYTGAGAVVREDVPAGALAVSGGAQHTVEGWVERRRAGSSSAQAAALAREASVAHLSPQARAERDQAAAAHHVDRPTPATPATPSGPHEGDSAR